MESLSLTLWSRTYGIKRSLLGQNYEMSINFLTRSSPNNASVMEELIWLPKHCRSKRIVISYQACAKQITQLRNQDVVYVELSFGRQRRRKWLRHKWGRRYWRPIHQAEIRPASCDRLFNWTPCNPERIPSNDCTPSYDDYTKCRGICFTRRSEEIVKLSVWNPTRSWKRWSGNSTV